MRKLSAIFISSLILLTTRQLFCAVEFQGNVVISDRELLRNIDPASDIKEISNRIKSIYYDLGYFEVQLTEESPKQNKDRIIIIDEGKSSRISRIDLDLAPDSLNLLIGEMSKKYNGQAASRATFVEFAERCINILAEQGMPFARGEWSAFGMDENSDIIAGFKIIPGPRTIISDIEFNGIKRTRPRTLEKAAGLKTGNLYSESMVSRAQRIMERLKFIEISSPYDLETSPEGDSCTVIYNIRELPSTRIEGVGGFVNVQGKRDFIGKADIEFGDILGTGRSFGLLWNKKDTRSNELRIKYGEPFIFNSRLDLELEAYQIDRDTLYITTGAKAQFTHNFGVELTGALHFSVERTVPETGSTVSNSIKRSVGTEFLYNKTDFYPNVPLQ
jgi:outer membrane protein assembly factor BamA